MSDVALSMQNINKYFGNSHVIKNVNLTINKGEFVTFLGPSGCGKTTLLRMVAGFYEPDEGDILLQGQHIEKLPPYARNTAMVFQEYALFPHMTVFDNVAYGLKVRNIPKDEVKERVANALALMQLEGMEKRFPNQMSGGQQQRVAVARALVMKPDVLLLDEPLSNLDAKLRESVRVELREIQQKLGLSTIYVTHDQSEALSMSDKVVVLKRGNIHQIGTPQEIYFEPKTAFVADFIGTTNLLKVTGCAGDSVDYHGRVLPVAKEVVEGQEYWVSLRPECAVLGKERNEKLANVEATISAHMFLGEKIRYFLKDEFNKEWVVDIFDPGKEIISGKVFVQFAQEKAWVMDVSPWDNED